MGIVKSGEEELVPWQAWKGVTSPNAATSRLRDVAASCEGLSGRSLRKMPFLAHALHISSSSVSLEEFCDAMLKAIEKHKKDTTLLTQ